MNKRIVALTLALVLLLGLLAGCSKPAADGTADTKQNGKNNDSAVSAPKYAYQAQYLDLPSDISWIGASCVSSGTLYFTASVPSGTQESYTDENGEEVFYDTYAEALFRMDLTSGECTKLENYEAAPVEEDPNAADGVMMSADGTWQVFGSNTNVRTLAAGADGTLWLYRETYRYSEDGMNSEDASELIQLDAHGTLLRTITPQDISQDDTDGDGYRYYSIDTILSDDQGYVYTYDYSTINVYGPDGSFVCSKSDDEIYRMCQLSQSEVGIVSSAADGSRVFKQLDPATKDWGRQTPLTSDAWAIYPGDDVYTYYYMNNTNLFGERRDTGETEKVVDWLSCDIDSGKLNSDTLGFLPDGRIVTILNDYSGDSNEQQVVVLNRVDASTVQEKTELTLACYSLDYNLRSQIVKFNKTSSDYRIVVNDYAEYGSDDEDFASGLTKLSTEIIAGNVPDLIANSVLMPMRQYAAKGLLEDLWPYIDADPEFTRDALMQQPLNAAQIDGKLYQLPVDFSVTTAIGLGKTVGGYDTWTLADLKDAMTKLPEGAMVFNKNYTQNEMLQYCVAMNAGSFMSWQDGTCNFDSDDFRALLEFTAGFPAEYDWQSDSDSYESDFSRIKSGKQLLYPTSIGDFDSIYYTFAALGGDVSFAGFPREDGSSGSCFSANVTLSITTSCKDKAAAWSFIRSTLSEEYQKEQWSFPILKSAFDEKAKEAMTQEYETDADGNQILDENGNPIPISTGGMSWGEEEMIELYAVTQEQYDAVMDLINSTTSYLDYDQNVLDIITEEAAGYFAGSKTLEEASRLIQSRVNLYIQEQK